MQDRKIFLAPAKLNVFLKILGKRSDGYHDIRSGITFINLFDKIEVERDIKTTISYAGDFQPIKKIYDDCIIDKTLNYLKIKKKIKLKINIIKNIPVQGGLGSASTNAATLIKGLEKMKLIEKNKPEYYAPLGADIPSFLFNSDCLVSGMGEKLVSFDFPKYFFLLIKPKFNNSTKEMYNKLKLIPKMDNLKFYKNTKINNHEIGNDFEKILLQENREFGYILDFIKKLKGVIFSSITGSGSCYYAAFQARETAINASQIFQSKFPNLWFKVCENNF